MFRYLALIWSIDDRQAAAAAGTIAARLRLGGSGWSIAFEAEGVSAYQAESGAGASATRLLQPDVGVVFGRIFNRDLQSTSSAVRINFAADESLRIVRSGGQRLLQRYWGRYVALGHDSRTCATWILRDPTGTLPCLYSSWAGVHLVFSDLEDALRLGVLRFSVNWKYIRGLIANPGLQVRTTGLNEVSEIQPGERVLFGGRAIQRTLEWDPLVIARADPVADAERAVTEVRATTRACVHAWASCYPGIIHNLSGGLDSSIVLSCLADAPSRPALTCLNYFGTGPEEDERRYARLMAQHVGAPLIEHQLDAGEARLQQLYELRRTSRPWFYLYELEHGSFERQLARQRGANGLFCGAGGDGVFFQSHTDLAVTDYLLEHPSGSGLLRAALDAARVSGQSVWPLLVKAWRARLFGTHWDPRTIPDEFPRTLVSRELLRQAHDDEDLTYPWFTREAIRGVPPGILWHAMSVSVPPTFYSSFYDGCYPERTLPLLSQPLLELCLRIPTYVLIRNGMDRATARRAFAADLPGEIHKRRAKGRIDQHVRNILDRNLDFVRDVLLRGRLVSEGLLDRRNLEIYLSRDRSPADFQYAEILQEHLCIETWLSRWLDDPPGAQRSHG